MATPKQLELALRLKAAVEGLGEIEQLAAEVTGLGGDSKKASAEAAELAGRFSELTRQQAVVELFKQVDAEATQASTALGELQAKAAAAGAEQARLESNLVASRQALETTRASQSELTAEISRSSIEVKQGAAQLAELRAATKAAGADNEQFKVAVAAATQELESKKRALAQQSAALKEVTVTERELATAVREDEAAIKQKVAALAKLQPEIKAAEAAQQKMSAEVERASNAMRYAGLDASKLAVEEQRIQRETVEAKNAVSQLTAELRDQRNELQSVAGATSNAARETEKLKREQESAEGKSKGFAAQIGAGAKSLLALGAAYVGLNEAKQIIVDLLRTGDQFEIFQKQLTQTFGSAAQGEAAFRWVREFAKDTPLELDQVLSATIKLKNFGLDPLDGTLQSLVDQNAKLGGSSEVLQRIITATGQAFAKGRLQGEELLQFAEAGVPVFDLLSQVTGKTTAEVLKLAEQGRLGRDVIRELIAAMGTDAAGAAAEQMSTLSGRVSTAKDNYQQFLNVVANNGPLQLAKDEIGAIGASLQDTDASARVIGQSIVALIQSLFALGNVGAAVAKSFKLAFDLVGTGVASVLANIALGISKITFGSVSQQFAEVADVLRERSREMAADASADAESIRQSYSDAYVRYGNAVGAVTEAVKAANGEAAASAQNAAQAQAAAADQAAATAAERERAAKIEAEALQKVRADVEALGLDYVRLTTGISEETAKSISSLESLGESSAATGAILTAAFKDALKAAKTQEDARAIAEAIKGIQKPGFDAAAAVAEIEKRLATLPTNAEQAAGGVAEAFKTLGVTSTAELERAVAESEIALGRLRATSGTTATQIAQGFAVVAEARLELAAAEGDAELKTEASRLRAQAVTVEQRQALEELIAKYPELGESGSSALDKVAASGKKVVDVLAEIKGKIGSAESVEQLDEVRSAMLRAFLDGKISAEDYKATLESVKEKTEELARASTGMAAAIANLVTGNRNRFAELSDDAAVAFDRMLERVTFVNQSVSNFFTSFAKGVRELERQQANQTAATERLTERLLEQTGVTQGLVDEAVDAANAFKFVDSQRLDALNNAIEGARSRLRGLRDDAASTVAALRDELDRLRGNEEAIEQRRRDAQRVELQQQLSQAQALGDKDAIAALRSGLQILAEIEKTRADQIRAEGGTPQTPAPTRQSNEPSRKLRLELALPGGNSITGDFDADQTTRTLEELARYQAVAGR